MKLRKNILELISFGHKYQYFIINESEEDNKKNKPFLFFSKYQFVILLISLFIVLFNRSKFSEDLSGYIISALSLFIGLFFAFIFTLFDKYKSKYTPEFINKCTDEQLTINKININFYKKVSYLTLYAILIAILTIILFSFNLIFDFKYPKLELLDIVNTYNCLYEYNYHWKLIGISIYQFISFYFLFDFLLLTLYILGAVFEYLKGEYKS